jgi:predicted nucleic acid-binding protein
MVEAQVRGALVTDAMLAAMVIEAGATLATTDRDFRRFDGLKLLDPIAEA